MTYHLLRVQHAELTQDVPFCIDLALLFDTFELELSRAAALVGLCDFDFLVGPQSVEDLRCHVPGQQVKQVLVDVPHFDPG